MLTNGDILLPPTFIDQLLASNVPTVTLTTDTSLNANNTDSQNISNNVNATASSGSANVTENTNAGDATTGKASTNLTVFNLTGREVVGYNDLLVFVNVMGTWVGMIVNAPSGATAAELGGGITQNSTTDANLTNNTNEGITNNVTASAQSGDATVSRNTTGGNATSGDARAAVNLLNVTNSTFSLANWFGILFINVFGSWHGSFGVNTAAGDPVIPPAVAGSASNQPTVRIFRFVPKSDNKFQLAAVQTQTTGNVTGSTDDNPAAPSPAAGVLADQEQTPTDTPQAVQQIIHRNWQLPLLGLTTALILLGFERLITIRQQRRTLRV